MPAVRTALCPACRCTRTTRIVGNTTVNGRRKQLVQCPDDSCGLIWAVRPYPSGLRAA
ncbi:MULTISPECIES: hypothetical protein [unclassified Streptomyces]|uniref:hypothetical protein n=1 Tax=unclassified Streptomyces TaxID=2593676 RepID=UPI003BB61E78